LLDDNATLYKLKELEYLEKICGKVGSISVGGGNLLSDLQKIVSVSPPQLKSRRPVCFLKQTGRSFVFLDTLKQKFPINRCIMI